MIKVFVMMYRTLAQNSLLVIFIGLSIWQTSLWIYDIKQDQKTLEQFEALENGTSLFRWEFDNETDITGAYRLNDFVWSEGKISGDIDAAAGRVANSDFWLNLRGRNIDTLHYARINLRVFSGEESEIYFFHQQNNSDALHVSERIKTKKGWQDIRVDLSQLKWVREDGFEIAYTFKPSSWGGGDNIATLLGLSPIKSGQFKVDWLFLESDFPPGLPLEPPIVIEERGAIGARELLLPDRVAKGRNRLWHLEANRFWRTPESDYSLHRFIQSKNPNVLLVREEHDLLNGSPRQLVLKNQETFQKVFQFFLWFLFIVSLIGLYFYPKNRWRSGVELCALTLGMVLFAWYQMVFPLWLYAGFLMLLCYNFFLLRPSTFNYQIVSSWASWFSLMIISVVPMMGVLVLSPSNSLTMEVALPALIFYIGWALLQQYIFVAYIFPRLSDLAPRFAVVLTATIFSYLHYPNFALMSVTFVMGLLWYAHYQRYRNWYAIAISHALLAVIFREVVPQEWRVSGEVGLAFLSKLGLL